MSEHFWTPDSLRPSGPSPQPHQGQGPGPGEPRRRHRRAWATGIIAVVLALAGGLVVMIAWPAAKAPVAARAPFYLALFNLSERPMLHYSGSSPAAGTTWDMVVTSGGEQLGTLTIDGQQVSVMTVSGTTYIKPPASLLTGLPAGTRAAKIAGQWITGDDTLSAGLPSGLSSPGQLASVLGAIVVKDDDSAFPRAGSPPITYHGTAALAAALPGGTLYVTATAPYRVLGVSSGASGATPGSGAGGDGTTSVVAAAYRLTAVRSAGSVLGSQADFTPMSASRVDQVYGDLIDQTKRLDSAVNLGVAFDFNQTGNLSCSDTSCTVTEDVVTSTTSSTASSLAGDVTADMTADVTVDGEAGGSCTATTSLPLNGSGTMTCVDAGVAPIVGQIKAQKQQQANAEAAANPGQQITIPYTLAFLADVGIDALAQAQGQVDQEVSAERAQQSAADQQSQGGADCLAAFSGGVTILDAAGLPRDCSNLFNGIGLQHALDGHMPGGADVQPADTLFSQYFDAAEIQGFIEDTVKYGEVFPNTPDTSKGMALGRGGALYKLTFADFPIGTTQGADPKPVYELWAVVNPDGTLRTAFPYYQAPKQ